MRLHLGYQNLITNSGVMPGGITDSMEYISGTISYGTTYAPDGSSTAYGVANTGSASWRGLRTGYRTDIQTGDDILIWGGFVKPTSDSSIRTVLYLRNDGGPQDFGYNVYFNDGSIFSAIDNPWSTSQDSLAYGYTPLRNNWFYIYMVCDTRNDDVISLDAKYFVNAPNGVDWVSGEGAYAWGLTLEQTKLRITPGPPIITGGNTINPTDFQAVEFTQIPSNIGEIDNDIFSEKYSLDGYLLRPSTHNDRNLKTMVWNNINYQTHGKMIYGIKSALRDKVERDCVLFYPSGFKSKEDWAFIRIVDFRFTYSLTRNMASLEVDYYVVSAQRY